MSTVNPDDKQRCPTGNYGRAPNLIQLSILATSAGGKVPPGGIAVAPLAWRTASESRLSLGFPGMTTFPSLSPFITFAYVVRSRLCFGWGPEWHGVHFFRMGATDAYIGPVTFVEPTFPWGARATAIDMEMTPASASAAAECDPCI